jgi:hypothetical protein
LKFLKTNKLEKKEKTVDSLFEFYLEFLKCGKIGVFEKLF